MAKKVMIFLICIIVLITAVSCGKKEEPVPDPDPKQEEIIPEPEPEPDPDSEPMPWDLFALNKLTGEYNIDKEFAGTRPVAVMVNNNTHGLPQRGIGDSDLLLEIEVEGGITRLMAFFSDYRRISQVGSVRSLRNQFLDIARPLDAMIIHVGASQYASDAVRKYGYSTLDAMGCSIVAQDKSRLDKYASEHTWFTNPGLIEKCIETKNMRKEDKSPETIFSFVEYGKEATVDDGPASIAEWSFSDGYNGKVQYDIDQKSYVLSQHGELRYDELTGKSIYFPNVFIIIASRPGYYGHGVPEYDYSSGGTGYYLHAGKYEEFTWTKDSTENKLVLKNIDGGDLEVNPGSSYIAIINTKQADTLQLS